MWQQSTWKEEPVDPMLAANANAEQREAKANSMYESSVQASDVECQPHVQEICTLLIPLREAVIPPSLIIANSLSNSLVELVSGIASRAVTSLVKAKDATIEAAQARVQATVDGIVSLPARLRSAAIDKAEETQAAALAKADEVQAALIAKVEDTKAEILATPQKLQASAVDAVDQVQQKIAQAPATLLSSSRQAVQLAVDNAEACRIEARQKRDALKEVIARERQLAQAKRQGLVMEVQI
ncbi:MAG: hypothetical protein SGPRY_010500 [Prymnesium sp.]